MSAIAPFDAPFAHGIYKDKYANGNEEWDDTAYRATHHPMAAIGMEDSEEARCIQALITERMFVPAGRYLYAAGRDLHQVQNCALYRAEDTREGWANLVRKTTMALMTGAGVGVDYSDVRASGSTISRTGGTASGPLSLMKMVNEVSRNVMQGGLRRSAIWAGLRWDHADIFDFIEVKNWPKAVRELKERDFTFPADLDMTNISVILDKAFFDAYGNPSDPWHAHAVKVYDETVKHMLTTAEPGFSVNYENPRESLRNACTEITSEDDSDICNLGSLNLARFHDIVAFGNAVELGTLYLLAGTVYSDLPHEEVYHTREKNRRLGLGLMGVHEWLLKRGKRYGPDAELGEWLAEYAHRSRLAADLWAARLGLSRPVKVRAIAPNGTIGIIAETTTSSEPMLAAAYKRRIRNSDPNGDRVVYEYVVDPTAARLVAGGVDPALIEDAYSLAFDVERRIEFQAWLQQYVDHGISSTINLPAQDAQPFTHEEFGAILMRYLPKLRGVTCYPDGARGGQPLTAVPIEYALDKTGVRFEENEDRCVGGTCGV